MNTVSIHTPNIITYNGYQTPKPNNYSANKCSVSFTSNTLDLNKNILKPSPDIKPDFSLECNNALKPDRLLRSDIIRERQLLLTPIKSEEEYDEIISRIFNYKDKIQSNLLIPPYISRWDYENADKNLKGLVAYCGYNDRSDEINRWLTARPLPADLPINDKQMANIIRAMDYSLQRLDEKVGAYMGIVYRNGFFNPNTDKQFYSTSKKPINAVKHANKYLPAEDNTYSIIKVKNGHNIREFQKETDSFFARKFAETEEEILIDRNSRFRLVPESEYTERDKRKKEILLAQAVNKSDEITDRDIEIALKQYGHLMQYISIWEEI